MMIMIILLVLLALSVLLMLAGVCAFHLGVGNGRFEDLDSSSWDGLFGSEQCDRKQRDQGREGDVR
jgi:cbb3-type cytochrome oxidase maturation protein